MSSVQFDLEDKVAIVTGAGRGLGRAMAESLSEAGANVAILDVNSSAATETAESITATTGGKALALRCDVGDEDVVISAVSAVFELWNRIDILVNNAGINVRKPIVELSDDDFEKVNRVNLLGTFHCSKAVFPFMQEQHYGKIINIASLAAITILRGSTMSPYNTSKSGVVSFTKAAAAEWAPHGIRVNAVSPGWFVTDLNQHIWNDPELSRIRLEQTPMNRVGTPAELCGTIIYLASPASDYVTGQNIAVDGGFTVW